MSRISGCRWAVAISLALFLPLGVATRAGAEEKPVAKSLESKTFEVRQSVMLKEIPKDSRDVRFWVSIPDDDIAQRVLDMKIESAPGECRIVRDKDRGARFVYVEVEKPASDSLTVTVAFTVQRKAVYHVLVPSLAGQLTSTQKRLFADELRSDDPHMEVTPEIRKLAKDVCESETNPLTQANKLLNYVANHTDHYSKNPSKPKCGLGDAKCCIEQGGGCCTDLHSLFIALARATGIPARLQMGYRLQPQNAGIEADPGYRCWAEYFIAGYGWLPADIVEAQKLEGYGRELWLSGLNERRVHLNEGRSFDLPYKRNPERVNLMTIGYAEIDGKPARVLPDGDKLPQITRVVKYVERTDGLPSPLASSVRAE